MERKEEKRECTYRNYHAFYTCIKMSMIRLINSKSTLFKQKSESA